MSEGFTPEDGSIDDAILGIIASHIEQPMKTAVALMNIISDTLPEGTANDIASAAIEDTVVDLVTSAIALMTASWAMAGHDIMLDDETENANAPWVNSIIEKALTRAKFHFAYLMLDYSLSVGPIPTGGKDD
jgi:hypothetical protein